MRVWVGLLSVFLFYHGSPEGLPTGGPVAPVDWDLHRLHLLYYLGDKWNLSSWERTFFGALSLFHLFTPSGLHLSCLLFPLRWALVKLPWGGARAMFSWMALGLAGGLWWAVEGFYSLKRVALFCALREGALLARGRPWPVERAFWATFLLDYLAGSYNTAPLSFTYSFLFWGSLVSANSSLAAVGHLFGAQALLAVLQASAFHPLGALAGQGVTALFVMIFPLSLATFPISEEASVFFLMKFHTFSYALGRGLFRLSWEVFPGVSALAFLLFPRGATWVLGVIFWSWPCWNQRPWDERPWDPRTPTQEIFLASEIESVKYHKGYLSLTLTNQTHCRLRLKNFYYAVNCGN